MSPRAVPRTVAEILDRVMATEPAREAIVARSGRCSYAQLDALANRAAHALASLGARPGDRVAAALPNDLDVVVAFHGAMRLGAVWVGVNRALAPPEKAFILGDSQASILLCDPGTSDQVEAVRRGSGGGELAGLERMVVVEPWDATNDAGHAGDGGEWASAMVAAADDRLPVAIDPYAPAGIAYTSGTTGHPKGAVHSQHNMVLPGAATVASRGYGPGLRKGDCLPLTILNMLVLTTVLVAQAGGCSVIMDRIDPEGVAGWIAEERVTTWNGPPALIHGLATNEAVRAEDLASLDEVWNGGADCPEAVRAMFQAKFGCPVLATYGLTEAPTLVSIDGRDGTHRPGASGRPLPHLDVRIVGREGEPVAPGDTGEICVAAIDEGPWAGAYRPLLGYWQRPEASAEVVRGGLLHTGDLGYLDDDGFLFVRDRSALVIIRGGANVYPAEVERVLHAAPGVVACAVVGVPDERLGERVVAAVERQPGAEVSAEQLMSHCLANLARYKVPERFVFVDAFPRNSMGKISRRDLPALFEPT